MKRLFCICLLLVTFCSRAAVPTFESFSDQFETNSFRVFYRAVHTNDAGVIYPAMTNSLSIVTNENVYGTFSLPSKVEILTLVTNYLDVSTNSTWLLNSPTNDAAQVILSLSAGAHQGQLLFITSQNGGNSFTLPDLSEQWDVPGAFVDIQGDWTGTTNRGIILQYTAPDWIEMARFDPSGGGGGSVLGSGANPFLPYWLNATTLTNSPMQRTSATTVSLLGSGAAVTLGNALVLAQKDNLGIANPIASTGLLVNNTFLASSGVQQNSPGVSWSGQGWGTNTATSQSVTFGSFIIPEAGADKPSGKLSFYSAISNTALPLLVFTLDSSSGYTGTGANFLSDDGTYKTGTGGTTINPTDGFIPYRSSSTAFGDSAFYRVNAASTAHLNAGVPQLLIATNGNLVIGSTTSNFWSGFLTSGHSLLAHRDADTGGDPDFNAFWFSLVKSTNKSEIFGEMTENQTTFDIKFTDAASGSKVSLVEFQVDDGPGVLTLWKYDSITYALIAPSASPGVVPYFFDTLVAHTNDLWQLQNSGTNQFTVAAVSGYTGAGTLFLSDDGTYKAASGGGGAPVGTMVESGIVTAGVVPMSSDITGTNYIASPMKGTGTNVAFDGNITLDSAVITNSLAIRGNGALSSPVVTGTGTWITGGSTTANKPAWLIEPTGATSTGWSTFGTGLGINAASGFAGYLVDLQVNGSTKFTVDSVGIALAPFFVTTAAASAGFYARSSTAVIALGTSDQAKVTSEGAGNFQYGVDAATPIPQTNKSHDGLGTDKAGANHTFAAGQPTGTGIPGKVLFANTGTGTGTSSTLQPYTTAVAAGGTLKVSSTTTGNVGGGEDDLISYTIPAQQLGSNGDYLEFRVWGTTAANSNTKDIKIYFGSTVLIDGGAIVLNGVSWSAHGTIVRKTATTQTASCELTAGSLVVSITSTTSPAETLSGTVVFKTTGTSAIAPANDDIIQEGMILRYNQGL